MLEYAAGGQIISWDEDTNIFYNPRQKGYIEEDELRKIFRELIGALDYCKLSIYKEFNGF